MKKFLFFFTFLLTLNLFAAYNVGDTVLPEDNLSWTIEGPAGHLEIGQSSNIFNEIAGNKKVAMIFWGGAG
ncbi:MAG: hypothetical protein JXR69_11730 [Candidatus Delongbacteria bacterium]|nr:hypothetical protein [Candidatus Delongbacteria bacterium]